MKKKDYQNITDKIAQDNGLQIDNRQYFDPIYNAWMQGNFLRKLKYSHRPWVKIGVSVLFFFIPSLLWFSFGVLNTHTYAIASFFFFFLIIIYMSVGIRIFISGILDKRNIKKKYE